MDRKVLTLEEIINLDRRPTLQEMVDLAAESVEDYAKYLYHIGAIKYVPESLYEYDEAGYNYKFDYVLTLINHDYYYKPLNEEEYTIRNVEQFINESADDKIIESGFVTVGNNKFYYKLYYFKCVFAYKVNESNELAPLHMESVSYF